MVIHAVIQNAITKYHALMVKIPGNFYLTFMAKCSVLIIRASIMIHGVFDTNEHGNLHPCFHGQTLLFRHVLPWFQHGITTLLL